MSRPLTLAITAGDVGGIGPEVALRAMCRVRLPRGESIVVIGSGPVLRSLARRYGLPAPPAWEPAMGRPPERALWDPAACPRPGRRSGRPSAKSGAAAAAWVGFAVRGCMEGLFSGMVTAPVSKEGFKLAGVDAPGHTELLAELTGTRRYAMMLIGGPLRVVLATRHMPLSEVPRSVTRESVTTAAKLAAEGLSWLGVRNRAVAVCGLNPHAGEGGVLGSEEKRVIAPAVRRLCAAGLRIEGPFPADTVFHKAIRGRYGAVVAMYHDQGLAPLKMIAFETGVNLTLGLPIVRTSPDHGTAYDIAGKGIADCRSMMNAIQTARRLALKPNPWR